MSPKTKRRLKRIVKTLIIVYVLAGIGLYFFQDKLFFHPVALPADHVFKFNQPFEELNIPVSKDRNLNIIRFTVADSLRRGVVVYYHGNKQNVERYARFVPNFTKHGYEVLMPDYPGFGKTTGERTDAAMLEDAMQVYKLARSKFGKDSIILYGKSMGTGLAAYVASKRDCKRLILETPYYSIKALMRYYAWMYPVSWMAQYNFATNEYVKEVIVPVTIFHGTADGTIPFKHARWLAGDIKSPVQLIPLEKGQHNNLNDFPLFHQKLDSILSL